MLVLVAVAVVVFQLALHLTPLHALYFVVTTVTTTGYGDITPKDSGGLAILLTCGLMLVGSVLMATLYSILTDYIIRIRLDQLMGRQALTTEDHVILVGLGNVGFRVVQELVSCGTAVVVIEKDPDNDLRSLLPKTVPVLTGDGRDPDVLDRAGLANASAMLAVTEDDVTNLSACLMARSLNPNVRVVTRLFDDRFAGKAEASLPIDAAVSASRIASPVFVGAALFDDCVHAYLTPTELVVLRQGSNGFEAETRSLADA
jgi:voltage-gated potassium channel Kch